jgi:hypothetical protein
VSAYILDGPFAWPGGASSVPGGATGSGAATDAPGDTLASILARKGVATAAAGPGAAALLPVSPGSAPADAAASGAGAGTAGTGAEPPPASLREWLGRSARVVGLLDQFGIGMDLQTATSVHPR